jgi:hypothetical protein
MSGPMAAWLGQRFSTFDSPKVAKARLPRPERPLAIAIQSLFLSQVVTFLAIAW